MLSAKLSFPIQFYSAPILDPLVLGHRVINGVGGVQYHQSYSNFELGCPLVHRWIPVSHLLYVSMRDAGCQSGHLTGNPLE
jgi:hypothetical protein